jgi:hypothetical protein
MKSITFIIAKEFKIWAVLFGVCNILNVFSILLYKTQWKELYTQLIFVFAMSCFLYLVIIFVRIGIFYIKTLVKNRKNNAGIGNQNINL